MRSPSVAGLTTTNIGRHRHKLQHFICTKLPTFSSRIFFRTIPSMPGTKGNCLRKCVFSADSSPIPAKNFPSTSKKKNLKWAATALKRWNLSILVQALGTRTGRPFVELAEATGLGIAGWRLQWHGEVFYRTNRLPGLMHATTDVSRQFGLATTRDLGRSATSDIVSANTNEYNKY